MDKTQVEFREDTKEVVLICSDKLWQYIQDMRKKGLGKLDIVHVAQIYKEVKNLNLVFEEKENKNGN